MIPTVHTFYRSNIAPEMVEAQSNVFQHLGIPLKQWLDDTTTHCEWIDQILRSESEDDLAVIADIDAIPLNRNGFQSMVDMAASGALVGLAQVANHKDPNRLYAGPMFMAISRRVFRELGAPSSCRTDQADVAQSLTDAAEANGIDVRLIYPRFAIQPRWPLAKEGLFGVGTFYGEQDFFHLFESRKSDALELFCAVSDGVIAGEHDFGRYLSILGQSSARKRRFFGLLR